VMQTTFQNVNDASLLIRSWATESHWARVIIVHGYGEHSGRYQEIAEVLNDLGCDVVSYDRRGEGQSEGKHGHIDDFENQVVDFKHIWTTYSIPKKKNYILAHSLGGLIVATYLAKHKTDDIDGVFFSSPFLKAPDNMAPILKKIAPLAAKVVPWLPSVKLDPALITKDASEVKKYMHDPLIFHGSTNAKTGYEIMKAQNFIQANLARINVPFMVVHGTGDQISDSQGSQMLYDDASSVSKNIRLLPDLYHETMRSPEKELFFEALRGYFQSKEIL